MIFFQIALETILLPIPICQHNYIINIFVDVFGGKVTQKDLYRDGKLSGKSYIISQVTYHDRGVYVCETTNPFGVVQQCFTLNVLKNFG